MSQRMKAASIAFAVICVLTVVKFILYRFSGSIAVLSEAWHSIADIATTVLVFVSIFLQSKKKREKAPGTGLLEDHAQPGQEKNFFLRSYRWLCSVNTELVSALLISMLLTSAAASIFWKAIFYKKTAISVPLTTGLIFIGLSFGSYFLSRFEEFVGHLEESASLVADSHHNRADMAISLITGISLILYHFGINVDQWVGILIALYILTFALELLVNSVGAMTKGRQQMVFDHKFTSIVWKGSKLSTYKLLWSRFEERANLSLRFKKFFGLLFLCLKTMSAWGLRAGVIALILWYCSTALYTVNINETALLLRFGSLVNTGNGIGPGLHVKFFYPIDKAMIFNTESVQSLAVGNKMNQDKAMIWTAEHGDRNSFISGDNNLFLPYIIVNYRVNNVHEYYLNYEQGVPEKMLSSLTLQMLNHLFSTASFYDLVLTKRKLWTSSFQNRLQDQCNELGIGVEIVSFCLRDLHPPIELAGSYEEVIATNQLKVANFNYAELKANALLSNERTDKRQTVCDAECYVFDEKMTAEGETANYLLRYQGYKQGKKTMNNILYLKAAAKTLAGKKIYLVDPKSGIDENLLYIEKYVAGKK